MIWWLPWIVSTAAWLIFYGVARSIAGLPADGAAGLSGGAALVVFGAAIIAVNLRVNG